MSLSQQMCDHLNDILKTDQNALSQLLNLHVQCSTALEEHPYVIVGGETGQPPHLGPLGLINGFLRYIESGWNYGPIVAVVEDDGTVTRFYVHDPDNAKKHEKAE